MKLSIQDRLLLLGLLPQKGSFVTQRIVTELQQELSFTEDEISTASIKQAGDRVTWNATNDPVVDIEFGPTSKEVFSKALRELDQREELTLAHVPLYAAFVEDQTP